MNLDEAIKHAKEKSKVFRDFSHFEKDRYRYINLAEEQVQIAEWLEELKCCRKNNDFSEYADRLYKIAYNKAIDDFVDKISTYGTYDDYGNVVDALVIADELKKECAE